MKPFININDVELMSHEKGPFKSQYGFISRKIGARRLGYSLSVVPPGKKVCPFHNHHINEEMFFIIEGQGSLRFGDKTYEIKKHDVIACPPGGREVAHQIINTGTTDLKYLSLSTNDLHEICEYPDSNKVMSMVGDYGDVSFRHIGKMEDSVDYHLDEDK